MCSFTAGSVVLEDAKLSAFSWFALLLGPLLESAI
jgi:hypothetical protein